MVDQFITTTTNIPGTPAGKLTKSILELQIPGLYLVQRILRTGKGQKGPAIVLTTDGTLKQWLAIIWTWDKKVTFSGNREYPIDDHSLSMICQELIQRVCGKTSENS